MRLLLSSENIGNHPEVFLELVGGNHRLATIHNAIDDWADEDKQAKVQAHTSQLKSQGFTPEDIDLRDFFGEEVKLRQKLSDFDGVFVFGGNSFIVRKAFAYSGLDKLLPELLSQDKLAYGGSSAGAILATPSLKQSAHGDEPEKTPSGYKTETIWDGLNLVPFYIVPHYKSSWWGEDADKMEKILKESHLDYYALEDGQVVVVSGSKVEMLK